MKTESKIIKEGEIYVPQQIHHYFLKIPSLRCHATVPSFNTLFKTISLFSGSCFNETCTVEITSEFAINFCHGASPSTSERDRNRIVRYLNCKRDVT